MGAAVQAIKRVITGRSPYRAELEQQLEQAKIDARGDGLVEAERLAAEARVEEDAHRQKLRGGPWRASTDQEAADTLSPDGATHEDGSRKLIAKSRALYMIRSNAENRAKDIRDAQARAATEIPRLQALLNAGDDVTAARNAIAAARGDINKATGDLAKLDETIAHLEAQIVTAEEAHRTALVADATAALDAEISGTAAQPQESGKVEALRTKLDRLHATVAVAKERRPVLEAALADANGRRGDAAQQLGAAMRAQARFDFAELLHGQVDVIARWALAEGATVYRTPEFPIDWTAVERAGRELDEAMRA